MIQDYFNLITIPVNKYASSGFVLDTKVNFDIRPGDQRYLSGAITFEDGSTLVFREFLDYTEETLDKLMYTYHFQEADNQLIFRYDNARHRTSLRSLEHKHVPGQVVEVVAPTLEDVLAEIVMAKGWV